MEEEIELTDDPKRYTSVGIQFKDLVHKASELAFAAGEDVKGRELLLLHMALDTGKIRREEGVKKFEDISGITVTIKDTEE